MQEDQKGFNKNNIRAEEEQITAARSKQHEDKEEDTGIRPARTENNKGTEKHGKKNKTSKTTSVIATAFALPLLNSTKTNKNDHSVGFRAIIAHVSLISLSLIHI